MKHMQWLAAPACATLALFASGASAHHPGGPGNAGSAGPINIITATTLEKGQTVAGVTFEYIGLGGLSDHELEQATERAHEAGEDGHMHSIGTIVSPSLGLAYGLTNDLTFGLRLPYVKRGDIREGHKHDPADPAEIEYRGDATGFGDISTMAQWRFLNDTASGTEAAVLLGVKAPTGKTHEEDANDQPFETEFLPGSGSWDGMFGLALTAREGLFSFDASGLYTLAGTGQQQTDLGDRAHYGVAVSYRALGAASSGAHEHAPGAASHSHAHEADGGSAIDLVLELNGEWSDYQEVAGVEDPNSGGNTLYFSPGVRFSEGQWSGFVSVGVPVVSEVNGVQSEAEIRVVSGAALSF